MAPFESVGRNLQTRLQRCQKLADLLRADQAGARFAALAAQIEQQLQDYAALSASLEDGRRHREALRADIDRVIARSRSELFFSEHLLRDHTFSSEDLREESRLCREEARASGDGEERRGFARSAFDLAMLAEAVERSPTRSEN